MAALEAYSSNPLYEYQVNSVQSWHNLNSPPPGRAGSTPCAPQPARGGGRTHSHLPQEAQQPRHQPRHPRQQLSQLIVLPCPAL